MRFITRTLPVANLKCINLVIVVTLTKTKFNFKNRGKIYYNILNQVCKPS